MADLIKKFFKPKIELMKGTRFTSFLFIGLSVLIAAGILWGANVYYNIDTGEIVMEEIQRVTQVVRATAGLIVGGTASQNPATGYSFQVVGQSRLATTTFATGTVELIAPNQLLRFTGGISGYQVGFRANASATSGQSIIYTLPSAPPTSENYVLTSDTSGNWIWASVSGVGAGDITAVGNVSTGEAFTFGGSGSTLWFHSGTNRGALTIGTLTANATYTLPAVPAGSYNFVLATTTPSTGYVTYWTSANTLGAEQYLSTTRGGIGQSSAGWSGMVRVVGGNWGTITGTPNHVAYWLDANTIGATATLPVSMGGTGRSSWTSYGVLYADGSASLTNTSAGSNYQILTSQGGVPGPTWRNISDLIVATNGITATGTSQLTLRLGGTLTENTTISLANFNMIFNLTGTGDFRIQDSGSDVFVVTDTGEIYYKGESGYPLAQTGKQILKEMIPIMGFDLPVRTATSANVQISRDIQTYPASACEAGTSRVHKLVIRYGSMGTTTWAVATSSGAYASFQLPPTNSTSTGTVYTATTDIPVPSGACTGWSQNFNTDDWWVRINPGGNDTMIYQIFLAIYDQIQ